MHITTNIERLNNKRKIHYIMKEKFIITIKRGECKSEYPKTKAMDVFVLPGVYIKLKFENKYHSYYHKGIHIYWIGTIIGRDNQVGNNIYKYYLKNQGWNNLNGNYVIFIVDEIANKFICVTDRINSRKVLFYKADQDIILSNYLQAFEDLDLSISWRGIGWYITNGSFYNNTTVYEEVTILDRACVHAIQNFMLFSKKYWDCEFDKSYYRRSKRELLNDYDDLLLDALKTKISHNFNSILTLTGGYDSCALLGYLIKNYSTKSFECMTYTFEEKVEPFTDEFVAQDLCDKFDIRHHIITGCSNADCTYLIEMNCLWGEGYSPFVGEVDAWTDPMLFGKTIITGDVFSYAYQKREMENTYKTEQFDLLSTSFLYNTKELLWLQKYFPHAILTKFEEVMNDELELVRKRIPEFDDIRDQIDYLWLDQKLSHVSLSWKENFVSRNSQLVMPLLDYNILDFLMKLPSSLRYNKKLFIELVTKKFPEIFSEPRAKSISFPKWNSIVKSSYEKIQDNLKNQRSKLDDIFEPECIKKVLSKTLNEINVDKNHELQFESSFDKIFGSDKYSFLILRLLVLRSILQK